LRRHESAQLEHEDNIEGRLVLRTVTKRDRAPIVLYSEVVQPKALDRSVLPGNLRVNFDDGHAACEIRLLTKGAGRKKH
jgi:hypothetical protein